MMTIKAECNAGDHIKEAFTNAINIAEKLNCYIEFDFNGVTCCAGPTSHLSDGVNAYNRELEKKEGFKYAFA